MSLFFWFDHSLGSRAEICQIFSLVKNFILKLSDLYYVGMLNACLTLWATIPKYFQYILRQKFCSIALCMFMTLSKWMLAMTLSCNSHHVLQIWPNKHKCLGCCHWHVILCFGHQLKELTGKGVTVINLCCFVVIYEIWSTSKSFFKFLKVR